MLPALAFAVAPEKVAESKRLFKEGQVHYDLGRFDAALASYSKAYEANPLPEFLFNIGQCYLQIGSYERAIFFYEGYLRGKKDAINRTVVEGRIAEARAKLDEQLIAEKAAADKAAAERIAEKEAAEREKQLATSKSLGIVPTTGAAAAAPAAPTPAYRKWWFLTLATGAALAAGGGAAYATRGTKTVEPSGSLGTIDRRE